MSSRPEISRGSSRIVLSSVSFTVTSGLPLAKIVKQHRKKSRGGAVDRADADGRPLLPAAGVESGRKTVRLCEQDAGFLEQDGAIIGQRHAARGSRHQPGAEIVLEQPDMTPERRRHHFKPVRRAAEMQFLGRGNETAKLVQVHAGLHPGRLYQIFV